MNSVEILKKNVHEIISVWCGCKLCLHRNLNKAFFLSGFSKSCQCIRVVIYERNNHTLKHNLNIHTYTVHLQYILTYLSKTFIFQRLLPNWGRSIEFFCMKCFLTVPQHVGVMCSSLTGPVLFTRCWVWIFLTLFFSDFPHACIQLIVHHLALHICLAWLNFSSPWALCMVAARVV